MSDPSAQAPGHAHGMLLVISGPSGVGKTTIVHEVVKRLGGVFSVSATTRPRTRNEVDGEDYFFLSEDAFQQMLDRGELLEHAQVFGKSWYGTPRKPVEEHLAAGRMVVLEIDVQGAQQIKQVMPDAFAIFILPPSEDELERRLRGRGRDDEQAIQRRFAQAQQEIAFAKSSDCYNAFIVNDDLEKAIDDSCEIIMQQRREQIGGR